MSILIGAAQAHHNVAIHVRYSIENQDSRRPGSLFAGLLACFFQDTGDRSVAKRVKIISSKTRCLSGNSRRCRRRWSQIVSPRSSHRQKGSEQPVDATQVSWDGFVAFTW
jgi:hypothetical protein